jgi:hypothetical protein
MGSKDGEALVVFCPLEEKEVLLEAAPEIYFETDHYKGYPAILVRPDKIDKRELKHRLKRAWYERATKPQIAEYEARNATNKAIKKANDGPELRSASVFRRTHRDRFVGRKINSASPVGTALPPSSLDGT